MINCFHCFHKQCMSEWLKIKNSCPMCRKKVINDVNDVNEDNSEDYGDSTVFSQQSNK